MKPNPPRAAAAAALLLLPLLAQAYDPVMTDSRVITEERRLALLEGRIASLQKQLDLIEDARAVERLQQAYGHYVSEGQAREAALLFADRPESSIEFGQQGVYLGRQRIETFLTRAIGLKDGEIRETPLMQGVVHVAPDGRTAKARWRSLVMGGVHGADGTWHEGPYENEYVKVDGRWQISRLHWYTTVHGSYARGWHRDPLPIATPLADLPPDRPPTEVYKAYPDFYLPPYHYFNPVTGRPVAWESPR
jgi:hypothetical protein